MHYLKKSMLALGVISLIASQTVFALTPKETSRYFNGPTVSSVGETSATISLSSQVLTDLTDYEKQNVYFEYGETYQVCIMIYPTPSSCLPKKTELGKTSVTLAGLKPDTSYTVTYRMDNSIRCITTPCPSNEFQSQRAEFTTKSTGTTSSVEITKNLWFGSRGPQVTTLQTILVSQGYLKVEPSGYFGLLTLRAVREFQRAHSITATGFVGPLTRKALASLPSTVTERFEGAITAYSTQCFVDGECSITVDGKKIVTTTGWSQQIVGSVTGIPDFGSIESKVGAHAQVYARKTADGYTLYGNQDYYIHIQ